MYWRTGKRAHIPAQWRTQPEAQKPTARRPDGKPPRPSLRPGSKPATPNPTSWARAKDRVGWVMKVEKPSGKCAFSLGAASKFGQECPGPEQ